VAVRLGAWGDCMENEFRREVTAGSGHDAANLAGGCSFTSLRHDSTSKHVSTTAETLWHPPNTPCEPWAVKGTDHRNTHAHTCSVGEEAARRWHNDTINVQGEEVTVGTKVNLDSYDRSGYGKDPGAQSGLCSNGLGHITRLVSYL
jgi:hypothetical protein